jgi:agmatinase
MMTLQNFLGLSAEQSHPDRAKVLVLPIPMEATVSYGKGTARGPAAIIAASQEVELYDREFGGEPACIYGVHTLPTMDLPPDPAAAVEVIAAFVRDAAGTGSLLVGLGGEHTVSVGFCRGLLAALGGPLTVVQIDAHSDLRGIYGNTPFSHACIARRLLENQGVEQLLQLGVRSLCSEEADFIREHPEQVRVWYAEDVHAGDWRSEFTNRIRGRRIFLTIDVDGLDPCIVPSTGTPEPDGLTWSETLDILRTLTGNSAVVGLDCVELSPVKGLHAADFAVAKLLYKAINLVMGQRLSLPKEKR